MANYITSGAIIGLARTPENTLVNTHNKIKNEEYAIRVTEKTPEGQPVELKLYDQIHWDGLWCYTEGKNPVKIPRIENKVLTNILTSK